MTAMTNQIPLVECVPNFSEGRNSSIILQIADAISSVDKVKVLHVDMGYDANRTVITFVGSPEGVEKAAFLAMKKAAELIDMSVQKGTHPRLGATDVMPIIPISNFSIEDAIALSYRLSHQVCEQLHIPVYNYEHSARSSERQKLENIRKGEYEALPQRMTSSEWIPDYSCNYNAQSGAVVIGARKFLLAYNVNIKTRDVALAKEIAGLIRESGIIKNNRREKGLLTRVKAIGWDVPEYNMVQVSTNITDTNVVSLHQVYELIKKLAAERGFQVAGSELIGLAPLRCLLESGKFYAEASSSEDQLVDAAIEHLGLNSVVSFQSHERIIEYLL